MADEMTKAMKAAAMHGIAENTTFPDKDRLACALEALEYYATEVETLTASTAESERPVFPDEDEIFGMLVKLQADTISREKRQATQREEARAVLALGRSEAKVRAEAFRDAGVYLAELMGHDGGYEAEGLLRIQADDIESEAHRA